VSERAEKVARELEQYQHPLFAFAARQSGEEVVVEIHFKDSAAPAHVYEFTLRAREIDSPQFRWNFQRQLYDCLHDYVVEMFTRTPQMKTY
jgi:hypothetical protein